MTNTTTTTTTKSSRSRTRSPSRSRSQNQIDDPFLMQLYKNEKNYRRLLKIARKEKLEQQADLDALAKMGAGVGGIAVAMYLLSQR